LLGALLENADSAIGRALQASGGDLDELRGKLLKAGESED
jgi:hypothetical protein